MLYNKNNICLIRDFIVGKIFTKKARNWEENIINNQPNSALCLTDVARNFVDYVKPNRNMFGDS